MAAWRQTSRQKPWWALLFLPLSGIVGIGASLLQIRYPALDFLTGIMPPFGVSEGMGKRLSAGILLYRIRCHVIQSTAGSSRRPFLGKKDDGVWSIPKGECDEGADPLEAAKRQFHEETGFEVPGEPVPFRPVHQPS